MKITTSRLLGVLLLAGLALPAAADVRDIPASTKQVKVSPYTSRSLLIEGKEVFLTAGARIHSDANRTVVPGRVLPNSIARVMVERDGRLSEVWILTPDEIARGPRPTPNR